MAHASSIRERHDVSQVMMDVRFLLTLPAVARIFARSPAPLVAPATAEEASMLAFDAARIVSSLSLTGR
jgi:hypothetical protein